MWLGLIVFALIAVWVGLKLKPKPFPAYPERAPELKTVPLLPDLPPMVLRYFKAAVGDSVPVVESAVITGRGTIRLGPVKFPMRFRFTHRAGYDYRHYIEATLFGIPILKANERYVDGHGLLELPIFGTVADDPKINSAANLGLWGETMWLPSLFVTDPRVRWEAVDDTTARLFVPYGEGEDQFTVIFDPQTGLIERLETMRWRDVKDTAQLRWTLIPYGWTTINGVKVPLPGGAVWEDQGYPWLVVYPEEIVYNVDVSAYLRQRGI